MVIKYDISDWKNLMKICGTVAAFGFRQRPILGYISIYADTVNNVTTCYACNGYQAGKLVIPCRLQDVPHNYRLMILPVKAPSHTRSVEIHIDGDKKSYIVIFIDDEDEIVGSTDDYDFFDGEPLDVEQFYKKAQEAFDKTSQDGSGKYFIAVNPKYLISALEGMKSCEIIIMNFAERNQAFTIRPFNDGSIDAAALVLPVRITV